jgi:ABC-type lipoprotein export system ATPase subunit
MNAIEISDAFCLYAVPGGATVAALRGMTLHVAAGERVVVHGPNGSGKTSMLRMLTGELAPSAGSVTLAGIELAGATPRQLTTMRRDVLGIVDQHAARTLRPELDVLDNVGLQLRLAGHSRGAARARARELLDALELGRLASRKTPTLSGGEAQRVAVCAAIAHEPAVILADEPCGELDGANADAVYELLAAASQHVDAAMLIVTHDGRAARIAHRVVRIRDGRLSEQWNPASPDQKRLVVDARGWLRLPERARQAIGLVEQVEVRETDGGLLLFPDGPAAQSGELRPLALPSPDRVDAPVATGERLALAYGDRVLFDGMDITLEPAALTVLRGRSGTGKSTLLRLLLGLADPDSGVVRLGGVALGELDRPARAALRRQLTAVAAQSGALGETLDASENLALALAARGLPPDHDAVVSVMAALDLTAVARRPARLMSGGERQRVTLARSLVVRRPLVVLDEPTSQQDEAHAELVAEVLTAAARSGTTVLCATHDPLLVSAASTVVELS